MLFTSATLIAVLAFAPFPQNDSEADAAPQAQTEAAAQEGEQEEERVRCRYEQLVHSRIPQRICRTESQWARIEAENQEARDNNSRNRGSRGESGAAYGAEATGGI